MSDNEVQSEGPTMPWCRKMDAFYDTFLDEVKSSAFPGLTIEEVYESEREVGLRK